MTDALRFQATAESVDDMRPRNTVVGRFDDVTVVVAVTNAPPVSSAITDDVIEVPTAR